VRITEIYIKSFGKLRGVKITPVDGVNIIYGENEAGKSTVMAFVLSMLYGVGKGEQRHRYDPWSGGRMSGVLSLECDGREYTLTRQFGVTKAADKTELWCKTSGEMVDLPQNTEPGTYLLKINRESFVNTVFIGQAGTPIHGNNNEILAKLTNLATSGDETASHTEISERLAEASAALRSRRANAIIPSLEKQRQELLEERAVINQRVSEAETLRDDLSRLSSRQTHLEAELEQMLRSDSVQNEYRRLAELRDIAARREQLDAVKEKYDKLHDAMFSEGSISQEFIEQARSDLDQYNSQCAVVRTKQERLSEIEEKLRTITRNSPGKLRVIKRNADEISNAIAEYTPLSKRKAAIEREMESQTADTVRSRLSLQSVVIVAAAVAVILFMLGFISSVFFWLFGLTVLLTGAYIYVQKKGFSLDGAPKESIELQNINDSMRAINRNMRPVLDELAIASVDELEGVLQRMSDQRARVNEIEREKEAVLNDIASEREQLEEVMQRLKDRIYPYMSVESDDDVLRVINTLSRAQIDHEKLETRYNSEKESYEALLAGRDADELMLELEELTAKLGTDEPPQMDARLAENIDDCRSELESVRMELVQKETSLGMLNSDPQELNKISDNIKTLTGRIDKYEFEYEALQEASSALNAAFESMQKDFGPMINYRAGKIVSELTGGKYPSVVVSESLVPSVAEPGGGSIRSCFNLSAGTVDQLYLALRLAISDMLTEEKLPVMLDDAFAQFDDKRMTDALAYIRRENEAGSMGQVILFTCHDRLLLSAKEVGLTDGIVRLR